MYPPRYVFIRELDDFALPVVHPARDFFVRTRLFHDSRNWGEKKIAKHRERMRARETHERGKSRGVAPRERRKPLLLFRRNRKAE